MDRIIAIGVSAGSIDAIKTLCDTLPADIPAAACIVVHVGARGKTSWPTSSARGAQFRSRPQSTARGFCKAMSMSRPPTII